MNVVRITISKYDNLHATQLASCLSTMFQTNTTVTPMMFHRAVTADDYCHSQGCIIEFATLFRGLKLEEMLNDTVPYYREYVPDALIEVYVQEKQELALASYGSI